MPRPTLARQADRHALYERAVQGAEAEVDFVQRCFRALRGRPARVLREDFCGTALVCREWVRRHRDMRAIGVDLDAEVLSWAERAAAELTPSQRSRLQLLQADVRAAPTEPADVVLAMNFSYWLFHQRADLAEYFRRVHRGLAEDGVFLLDAYGGAESHKSSVERRRIAGRPAFTYVWEQAAFNPIDHRLRAHIHFEFKDGSRLHRAFSYDWRLWTLPELLDLLRECGFAPQVYWQGWDGNDPPDAIFRRRTRAEPDPAWICYIAAARLGG
jgi:SAM-dependent methyltransferase